jgi:hypothetical protein
LSTFPRATLAGVREQVAQFREFLFFAQQFAARGEPFFRETTVGFSNELVFMGEIVLRA